MTTSRRDFAKALGLGSAALLAAGRTGGALAQGAPVPPADIAPASSREGELKIAGIDLLEEDARKILPPQRFAFMGPAGEGVTYRENHRAFNDYPIMPRRLQGISGTAIDLRVRLMGHELPLPMITCPMGGHGMFHVNAEVATAGGTGMAGTLYVSSGAAHKPMEDIAQATSGPKWFQIYMNRDMEINRWLVQRAKAAGFSAIVLTADALGPNQAEAYIRLGSFVPPGLTQGNHDPARGGRGNFRDFKRDLSFSDIGFLREASGLPVVVKGVVQAEDIRESLAAGAAAIWVSNHGGRQLDGVPAAISMLRPAVDVVAGRAPIIFDSGVRRGIDVFKALALGATVVAVGRPVLWGLIAGGAPGVKSVYGHLAAELRAALMLAGVARAADIKRAHLAIA
ncbi:MAG: alpha-hydroxy-acid oxidizing protein [Hyphomicrobiales bacterium]|nr:alpha-hydroxy-acid oxidizing protein [Hyphomicrobiales bacterium]